MFIFLWKNIKTNKDTLWYPYGSLSSFHMQVQCVESFWHMQYIQFTGQIFKENKGLLYLGYVLHTPTGILSCSNQCMPCLGGLRGILSLTVFNNLILKCRENLLSRQISSCYQVHENVNPLPVPHFDFHLCSGLTAMQVKGKYHRHETVKTINVSNKGSHCESPRVVNVAYNTGLSFQVTNCTRSHTTNRNIIKLLRFGCWQWSGGWELKPRLHWTHNSRSRRFAIDSLWQPVNLG